MKVVVLGAGVVGVAAAHALARDGHEVTLVDRNPEAAAETSFANAGLIAPGHAFAWATPKAPGVLVRSLFQADQALRLKLRAVPGLLRWGLLFLSQCTDDRARINTVRKLRLALYSRDCLREVVAATGVSYDGLAAGNLYLYRDQASFAAGAEHMRILQDQGLDLRVLDRDQTVALEPALEPVKRALAGAVYSPEDESGDARMFSRALAHHCRSELGVTLRFGVTIRAIERDGGRVTGVATDAGRLVGDAYVLALGCDSPRFGRPLGLRLPIYPVKGYSVTIPSSPGSVRPRIGGVDEQNLVAFCPMGERFRITSTAEFAGHDRGHRPEDFRGMLRAARGLFPRAGDYDRGEYWAGLRPMTPEGTPILGRTWLSNLFLDTGHGHMGWTWACGAARIVADLVADRDPDIDLAGMTAR